MLSERILHITDSLLLVGRLAHVTLRRRLSSTFFYPKQFPFEVRSVSLILAVLVVTDVWELREVAPTLWCTSCQTQYVGPAAGSRLYTSQSMHRHCLCLVKTHPDTIQCKSMNNDL